MPWPAIATTKISKQRLVVSTVLIVLGLIIYVGARFLFFGAWWRGFASLGGLLVLASGVVVAAYGAVHFRKHEPGLLDSAHTLNVTPNSTIERDAKLPPI